MTPILLGAVAAITYGSRLAAMAVLPRPTGRVATILERVVPAIFASIATLSLVTDQGLVAGPILLAALGALLAAPRRSFALCLVAGLAGYLIGQALL